MTRPSCTETVLSEIERGPVEFAVSPDATRVAYVVEEGGSWQVVVNGEESQRWTGVKQGSLVFSPDSSRLVYAAEREGEPLLIVDGDLLWGYGELTTAPVFSPDSAHWALATQWKRGERLVLDGQVGSLCEGVGEGPPAFSPTSRRVAYTEMAPGGWRVAIAEVGRPACAQRGPLFDGIALGTPLFSPDGGRTGYVAGRGGKFAVVVDGEASALYDGVARGSLVFSRDSRHFAYVAREEAKSTVVLDGRRVAECDDACMLQFGPAGAGHCYLAKMKGRWFWIVDETYRAELRGPDIHEAVIAEDLSRIAYVFSEGEGQVLMLDDTEVWRAAQIGHLRFSPDSRHLACVASDGDTGESEVVLDGTPGPGFRGIVRPGLAFSPDSRHLVYAVDTHAGHQGLAVDHEVVAMCRQVCPSGDFYFPDGHSVRLVVLREGGTVAQLATRLQ